MTVTVVCIPLVADGRVGPGWGRSPRPAAAEVDAGVAATAAAPAAPAD
jgi:hypothetical protein